METHQAIIAFSQSEKLKAGLIWASQLGEIALQTAQPEKAGAENTIRSFLGMLASEIHLARKVTALPDWDAVEKNIDLAIVMINSGAVHEISYHLTQALSQVTSIAQRSMTLLKDRGLL